MKKPRLSRLAFVGSLGATSLSAALPAKAADSFVMRLATSVAATHPFSQAGIHLAQIVNRRSNGQIKIEVYPSGQLVGQSGLADALASGVADFAISSTGSIIGPSVPQSGIFDVPFMFKDANAVYKVVDGPVGDELSALSEARGVKIMTWSVDFKEISTTNKAVTVPEDMRGIRMRIQNSPIFTATYQALGAIPVVIDTNEIFIALQQHTIDAVDVNLTSVGEMKLYTMLKHVAMANHVSAVNPLFGSKKKIEALPVPLQKIIKEETKALEPFWRALTAKQTASDIQTMKDAGVAFTNIQYPLFRKAMEPVYNTVRAKIGSEFFEKASKAAASA